MPAMLRLHAAPATLVSLAVIPTFAVVALVALSGAEAAGQGQPKCGDKITADTTLHKDLVDCPNNGLRIAADNVTLDLNGHLIDGDGEPFKPCSEDEFCDVGVLNRGHDGVTVMHGSEREFDFGVLVGRASHNRLLDISASGNQCCGFGFFRDTRSVIRDSSGSGADSGMFLVSSHHVRILDNAFRHNGDPGGIFVADSTHNLIK